MLFRSLYLRSCRRLFLVLHPVHRGVCTFYRAAEFFLAGVEHRIARRSRHPAARAAGHGCSAACRQRPRSADRSCPHSGSGSRRIHLRQECLQYNSYSLSFLVSTQLPANSGPCRKDSRSYPPIQVKFLSSILFFADISPLELTPSAFSSAAAKTGSEIGRAHV